MRIAFWLMLSLSVILFWATGGWKLIAGMMFLLWAVKLESTISRRKPDYIYEHEYVDNDGGGW